MPSAQFVRKRSQENEADPLILNEIRRALFTKTVKIKEGDTIRVVSGIDAYSRSLADQASRGNVDACRELNRIVIKLEESNILDEAAPPRSVPELEASREEYKIYTEIYSRFAGVLFMLMVPEFQTVYEADSDSLEDLQEAVFPYLELEAVRPFLERLRRRERRKNKGRPFDVGRGKTPVRTRWTKGVCGRTIVAQPTDAYTGLRENIRSPLRRTMADGRTEMTTRIAVSVEQLILKAIKGERGARRELGRLIDGLDARNLLSEPPVVRRPRVTRIKPTDRNAHKLLRRNCLMINIAFEHVKRELTIHMKSKYGCIRPFTSRIEQTIRKDFRLEASEIPAWFPREAGGLGHEDDSESDVDGTLEDYEADVGTPSGEKVSLDLEEDEAATKVRVEPSRRSRSPKPRAKKLRLRPERSGR